MIIGGWGVLLLRQQISFFLLNRTIWGVFSGLEKAGTIRIETEDKLSCFPRRRLRQDAQAGSTEAGVGRRQAAGIPNPKDLHLLP